MGSRGVWGKRVGDPKIRSSGESDEKIVLLKKHASLTALDLDVAQLTVHREVLQVHRARRGYGQAVGEKKKKKTELAKRYFIDVRVEERRNSRTARFIPNTPSDAARVVDPDEFVAGGRYVEVRLFLVHEERVRHPDVLDELRTHRQRLDPRPFGERQPGIRPKLSEVKVQRKVLRKHAHGDEYRGVNGPGRISSNAPGKSSRTDGKRGRYERTVERIRPSLDIFGGGGDVK